MQVNERQKKYFPGGKPKFFKHDFDNFLL